MRPEPRLFYPCLDAWHEGEDAVGDSLDLYADAPLFWDADGVYAPARCVHEWRASLGLGPLPPRHHRQAGEFPAWPD